MKFAPVNITARLAFTMLRILVTVQQKAARLQPGSSNSGSFANPGQLRGVTMDEIRRRHADHEQATRIVKPMPGKPQKYFQDTRIGPPKFALGIATTRQPSELGRALGLTDRSLVTTRSLDIEEESGLNPIGANGSFQRRSCSFTIDHDFLCRSRQTINRARESEKKRSKSFRNVRALSASNRQARRMRRNEPAPRGESFGFVLCDQMASDP